MRFNHTKTHGDMLRVFDIDKTAAWALFFDRLQKNRRG
jgi:hypothetical protein